MANTLTPELLKMASTLTPELLKCLQLINQIGRVQAETTEPDVRYVINKLWDHDLLNIAPPGWGFRVNAAGRALLVAAGPAETAAPSEVAA